MTSLACRARSVVACAVLAVCAAFSVDRTAAQTATPLSVPPPGWTTLFDGATLDGWDGRPDVWRVDAGSITGEVAHGPSSVTDTTYIIWKGGPVGDFELRAEVRAEGRFVNTGIVYRGFALAPGRSGANTPYKLGGPQLDFDAAGRYGGQFVDVAAERSFTAQRGQVVERQGTTEVVGSVGDAAALGPLIKVGEWNQLQIIALGRIVTHLVNGHVTSIVIDRDEKFRASGLLALQLEGAGRVRFRNIWLKTDQK